MEIEKYPLWKDDSYISIKELWENYTRRLYLQRLLGFSVLEEAINLGIKNGGFFGYAEVKLDAAKEQIEKETIIPEYGQQEQTDGDETLFPADSIIKSSYTNSEVQKTRDTHFYAGLTIDSQKLGTTAGQIRNEILQHFLGLPGVSIKVSMDIQVDIPEGTPPDIKQAIIENCKTLNIQGAEFRD